MCSAFMLSWRSSQKINNSNNSHKLRYEFNDRSRVRGTEWEQIRFRYIGKFSLSEICEEEKTSKGRSMNWREREWNVYNLMILMMIFFPHTQRHVLWWKLNIKWIVKRDNENIIMFYANLFIAFCNMRGNKGE